MSQSFSPGDLCDYVNGLAPQGLADRIARALEEDQELGRRVAALRQFSLEAKEEAFDPVPELWLARAKALVPDLPKPSWTEVVASLVWDSRTEPALGLRSGRTEGRQATYRAGSVAVDLQITPAAKPGAWDVRGVVYDAESPDAPGIPSEVEGLRHGRSKTIKTTPYGEFVGSAQSPDAVVLVRPSTSGYSLRIPLQLESDLP